MSAATIGDAAQQISDNARTVTIPREGFELMMRAISHAAKSVDNPCRLMPCDDCDLIVEADEALHGERGTVAASSGGAHERAADR